MRCGPHFGEFHVFADRVNGIPGVDGRKARWSVLGTAAKVERCFRLLQLVLDHSYDGVERVVLVELSSPVRTSVRPRRKRETNTHLEYSRTIL